VLRFIYQSRCLGFSVVIAELIGLWNDSQRSCLEEAVAQRHLSDLEEKRREIEQMMEGLSVLVQACHGNDQPHCAILDKLSLNSPAQHQRDHKPQLRNGNVLRGEATGGSSSPLDLMIWMHGAQVH
jgi:hypothetical protein